jgi:ketosteroid isomerase-like protein
MQGYERSAEVTFVGARVTRGYDRILENYRKAYGTPERMGKLSFSEFEAKPLGDDHAAVIGRFALERTEAGGGNASGRFTVLLRKSVDGWKIIHDHTSSDTPKK